MKNPNNYNEALAELEAIVQQIESDEPDIDALGALVSRAYTLLSFCKDRLHTTEEEIQQTLEKLRV
jgi:exodeoxyribonuclease VII small subunit